jgi:hypothetical protein
MLNRFKAFSKFIPSMLLTILSCYLCSLLISTNNGSVYKPPLKKSSNANVSLISCDEVLHKVIKDYMLNTHGDYNVISVSRIDIKPIT